MCDGMLGCCCCCACGLEKATWVSCDDIGDGRRLEDELEDMGNVCDEGLDVTAVDESECDESEEKVGYAGMFGIDGREGGERLGDCEPYIGTSWSMF